jgi:hypothetical protein
MASIELGGTLKALKVERTNMQSELAKLDNAITVLEELSGTSTVDRMGADISGAFRLPHAIKSRRLRN